MTAETSAFRYLSRDDVVAALATIDPVAVVAETLRLHSENRVVLTEEAYLPWRSPGNAANQCLAMPGAVDFDDGYAVGLKTINASPGNIANGLPRSQGFTLLLDNETARPRALMEAAYISALRTAAVTAVAAQTLGREEMSSMGLIGCGTQAMAHLMMLSDRVPTLAEVRLFDVDAARAERFRAQATSLRPGLRIEIMPTARECVTGMHLVVPATTVTKGYIPWDWLTPGTLVSNVSLDDLLPDVVRRCDLLVLDDWDLVSGDDRRLLGRMYRAGDLLSPSGIVNSYAGGPSTSARMVDATLGEVVAGAHRGRCADTDIVVCNAFGMAILDIAVAHRVATAAERDGIGQLLSL
jgi:ornithine cyclodeaminase